jgi:hypothetical protein
MRSVDPIEVPPYLCTINAIGSFFLAEAKPKIVTGGTLA